MFYFVEKIVHLVLFLVSAPNTLCRGSDDFAQNVFVANDVEVVLHVRRRWDEREQARDKCGAAHAFEQIPITQHLRERDQVDRLPRVPKVNKDVVDGLVRRDIKVFFVNFLDALPDCFAR